MSINERINEVENLLYEVLGDELTRTVAAVSSDPDHSEYVIQLPDGEVADRSLADLARLVAQTSNAYGKAARFAGVARAEHKLAKGRFDRAFKRNQVGPNADARKAAALEATADEHTAMMTVSSIAELADAVEHAARVASESARKIFDKVAAQYSADNREAHGAQSLSNITHY